MYDKKIESDIIDKAVNQFLRDCVGRVESYPCFLPYSEMSEVDKENLSSCIISLSDSNLSMVLYSPSSKFTEIQDQSQLDQYMKRGDDFSFVGLKVNAAASAVWLYDFITKMNDRLPNYDLQKLREKLAVAHIESAKFIKIHPIKMGLDKNLFLVAALVCLVLSVLLINLAALSFIFMCLSVMLLLLQIFLGRRILDEEMVKFQIESLGGIGEDEQIRAVLVSNVILTKRLNVLIGNTEKLRQQASK